MLLTKRAPISDVFTYKKGNFKFCNINMQCSKKTPADVNCMYKKNNIIKAMLCVEILNKIN